MENEISLTSKDIISFFGASVTQQKTGFPVCLSKKMDNITTYIHGYGGNHIDDAGVCYIEEVLLNKPTYCFIDWFSTDFFIRDTHEEYLTLECLDTLVYKFTRSNCKLIFLFLLFKPRNPQANTRKLESYSYILKYLNSRNLYYIDINNYLEYSADLLRDTVHTTELGSQQYADIIYSKFKQDISKIEYPENNLLRTTRFCDIKKIAINTIFKETITLEGNCVIVGFLLNIGQKSGIVQINNTKYKIWDYWCHYERTHFNIKHIIINDITEIKILQDTIDYSTCQRPINYDGLKELNVIEIYYIGSNLNISGI